MKIRPRKQHLLNLLPDAWVMTHGPHGLPARYLTFDDGPHPEFTPRMLDILGEHDMRASFFMVGRLAEQYPRVVERVVAEGHMLGNHSFNHQQFARLPLHEQLAEIDRTDLLLSQFDNHSRHRVRPPQGHLSLSLLLAFIRMRRSVAYWSYDSLDYQHRTAADVAARMRRQPPKARDIVLMHDDNDCAIGALNLLLPQWRAEGLQFAALPQEQA